MTSEHRSISVCSSNSTAANNSHFCCGWIRRENLENLLAHLKSIRYTNLSKAYTENMIFGVTSKKLHMMLDFLGVITHCNNASSNEADIGRWYTGSY